MADTEDEDIEHLTAALKVADKEAEEWGKTPAGRAQHRQFKFGNFVAKKLEELGISTDDFCLEHNLATAILRGEVNYDNLIKTEILCALGIEDDVPEVPEEVEYMKYWKAGESRAVLVEVVGTDVCDRGQVYIRLSNGYMETTRVEYLTENLSHAEYRRRRAACTRINGRRKS